MRQEKPILHGRDHCPGGADPIPCLGGEPAFDPFYEAVSDLAATRELRGYWRLGDGASPFADTSGFMTPADMVITSTGTAMSQDVTGALPAEDDDGAVEFNVIGNVAGDYLTATPAAGAGSISRYRQSPMTICAWVEPTGNPASGTGAQYVLGTQDLSSGGWTLGLGGIGSAPNVYLHRRDAGGNVVANGPTVPLNTWTFISVAFDTSGVDIYLNGALVYTDNVTQAWFAMDNLVMGRRSPASGGGQNAYQGGVDEVSVWGVLLTAEEIALLAASGGLAQDPSVRAVLNTQGAYTIRDVDDTILASNGTYTLTLPTAVGAGAKEYRIKNTGAGTITVAQNGSEMIDGSTTDLTLAPADAVVLISDGANWHILGSYP